MFILCNPYNPIGKVWKEDELKQIGEICKKYQVLFHTDAAQAIGKIDIDVNAMNIDLY